ncbi:hypothetical protein GCM10010412_065080 [Nonomuraea recticatena]|uniref:GNAT family N-acetyltransferase n=1 Tax=Nonomuraea recticatena TaxID=46178 RepID=A0ABN3SMG4_9ACTN
MDDEVRFRERSVTDADKLTDLLAINVAHAERFPSGCGRGCWLAGTLEERGDVAPTV